MTRLQEEGVVTANTVHKHGRAIHVLQTTEVHRSPMCSHFTKSVSPLVSSVAH